MTLMWVAALCSIALLSQAQAGPIVNTIYGSVEGFTYTIPGGFETQMFLGVPYAAAPVGNLRFEKPQPPTPWTGTINASAVGAPCSTIPAYDKPGSSEDCLFMNIIKPAAPAPPKGYPVIIYLHGGGFLRASDKSPTEIAAKIVANGVVFVSMNFRMAAFGFFSTGTTEARGNYGLWDQLQAMKFVQKVIHKFGGRPDKVTVMGHSSGSAGLSRLSNYAPAKKLFNQVILMSGVSVSLSSLSVQTSQDLTSLLGCSGAASTKACLKTKTTAEIQTAMGSLIQYIINGDNFGNNPFYPRVDGELITASNSRIDVRHAPKRNVFMGITNNEYLVFAVSSSATTNPNARYFPITPARAANYSKADFEELVDDFLGPFYGIHAAAAAQRIKDFYESMVYTTHNYYLQIYGQLLSDINNNIPTIREAKIRAKAGSDVHVYLYEYVPEYYANLYPWFSGAGHSSDQYNLFGGVPVPNVGDALQVQNTYTDLWMSFIKTGTPKTGNLTVPDLNRFSPKLRHIVIKPNVELRDYLWPVRLHFWNQLARDYGFDVPENRPVAPFYSFEE